MEETEAPEYTHPHEDPDWLDANQPDFDVILMEKFNTPQ